MQYKIIIFTFNCMFLPVFCNLNYSMSEQCCKSFSLNRTYCKNNLNIKNNVTIERNRKRYTSVVIEKIKDTNNIKSDSGFKNYEISWYSKIPLLPVVFASSPTIPEGNCKRHALRYLEELRNGTLWAVQSKLFLFCLLNYYF